MIILNKIIEVKDNFNLELSNVENLDQLDDLHNQFLSRKGIVASLFTMMGGIDPSDRPKAGNELNKLKDFILSEIDRNRLNFSEEVNLKDKFFVHNLKIFETLYYQFHS